MRRAGITGGTGMMKDIGIKRVTGIMRDLRLRGGLICLWLALAALCSTTPRGFAADGSFTSDDFAKLDKIDVHVHINTPGSSLVDQAQADHFRLLTINVDYPDYPPIDEQARIAKALVAS